MSPKRARGEKPAQMDPGKDGEELQGDFRGAVELIPSDSSSKGIAELKDMFQKVPNGSKSEARQYMTRDKMEVFAASVLTLSGRSGSTYLTGNLVGRRK